MAVVSASMMSGCFVNYPFLSSISCTCFFQLAVFSSLQLSFRNSLAFLEDLLRVYQELRPDGTELVAISGHTHKVRRQSSQLRRALLPWQQARLRLRGAGGPRLDLETCCSSSHALHFGGSLIHPKVPWNLLPFIFCKCYGPCRLRTCRIDRSTFVFPAWDSVRASLRASHRMSPRTVLEACLWDVGTKCLYQSEDLRSILRLAMIYSERDGGVVNRIINTVWLGKKTKAKICIVRSMIVR